MRMLLIGGSGFIGPHVVRSLVDRGHEVAALAPRLRVRHKSIYRLVLLRATPRLQPHRGRDSPRLRSIVRGVAKPYT